PSAATSFDGVAFGTSTTMGPEPPRSVSPLSSCCQLGGVKMLALPALNTGPAASRTIDSCCPNAEPGSPLPVVTNRSVPSEAIPPGPQMPLLSAAVAKALTCVGALIGMPATQPWYGLQSPMMPPYG